MHKQAINHKQAIIGGGYLFTENACSFLILTVNTLCIVIFFDVFLLKQKDHVLENKSKIYIKPIYHTVYH